MTISRASAWKWGVVGLLLLATTINYMDRLTLSSASVRVTQELGLNNAHYGDLEVAFGLAFAVGSLVFGFLADRLRVYYLYPAILVGWSLMGMATGWSHGFGALLVCRMMLGFFEAGHWPCAVKTTFAILNDRERTMGNSLLQSGASIGAVITPQILRISMTDQVGSWRAPFVAVGAAGLVWVALWLVLLRPRDVEAPPAVAVKADAPGLFRILRGGQFWAVALLIVGAQIAWHINRVWLVKFLDSRGYEEGAALNFSSLYYIASDVGCILAGVVSLRLVRWRGMSAHGARRVVYAGACALTSLSVSIPWLGKGWALLAVLLVIGAGALALFPCYYSFVQELSVAHVGRLTGILSLWVWALTSPLQHSFGALADVTKSYDLVLLFAGLAPWIGVASMKFLWRNAASPTAEDALSNSSPAPIPASSDGFLDSFAKSFAKSHPEHHEVRSP